MGKIAKIIETTRNRMDSWYNALTGVGSALRDKQTATYFRAGVRLDYETLELLFHENDVAATIVEALPMDALREGFHLKSKETDTSDINAALKEYQKRLEFQPLLEDCAVWSRLFGGAVLYLGIDDGQDESAEVSMDRIRSIKFCYVIDRRYIQPATWYTDLDSQKFGRPETYRVVFFPSEMATENVNNVIHESRLIRLEGARTSFTRRLKNFGWSESVLEKVDEVLTQFGSTWMGVSHLMTDAAQAVFKIKNLMDIMSGGGCSTLQSRMEVVEMSRSVARAILVDADLEDFNRVDYGFTGIPEVLEMFFKRLATAAQMPLTRLSGQSPAGMNATGESDIRLWYDRVKQYQGKTLEPAIERFWALLFAASDFTGGEPPEEWSVAFGRLWQPSDKEQAEIEKIVAEKDKVYIETGVVLPEEVAISRFTARGFSQETQVDLDAREEMLKDEIKLAKEQAGEPPPVPGMEGAEGQPPAEGAGGDDDDEGNKDNEKE
jgi:phage-related protein (TIGR01555 family)